MPPGWRDRVALASTLVGIVLSLYKTWGDWRVFTFVVVWEAVAVLFLLRLIARWRKERRQEREEAHADFLDRQIGRQRSTSSPPPRATLAQPERKPYAIEGWHMQRWLASQSKARPALLVFLGLVIVAAGVWTLSGSGAERYGGAFFLVVGAFNTAVGIAAVRERRSDSHS